MADAASNYLEDVLLNLVFNGTAYAGQSTVYCQLHIGAPGEDCTANVYGSPAEDRASVTFGAASGGTITTDANATWIAINATDTITAVSVWDAATTGNALAYANLSVSRAVIAGDTFVILAGDLTVTLG